MPRIFLCYRREDSKWPTHWIYNDLVDHFGPKSVVFDIDTIPLGADFREYLNKEVSKCDILLAVIGDQWIEILKQRLDDPSDYVRIEIQAALERNIPIVPILVGEKSVPSEKDLPPELANLSYKQATEVRAGADLQSHLKRLVDGLDRLFSESKVETDLKQKQVDKELKREETPKKYTNSIGMEFVLIPAGSFMMGSKLSYEEVVQKYPEHPSYFHFEYEHPQHKVTISNPFYLQTTQVTQSQWELVMGDEHLKDLKSALNDDEIGDDIPVWNISWDQAQEFIMKLNEIENTQKCRLPTEAEWEYACRAGTTTDFSFGDDPEMISEYGWVYPAEEKIYPVRKKKPNPWGLYDMHGNVSEWCQDWFREYSSSTKKDHYWPGEGKKRILRGGSAFCDDDAASARCAYRDSCEPSRSLAFNGLRCCMAI